MSDVPELDRLLDEHENYRRNMAWDRKEAAFVVVSRLGLTVLLSAGLVAIDGIYGVLVIPMLWVVSGMVFPKPQRRDPFKRYRSM